MADNNSNTSFYNSEPESEFWNLSIWRKGKKSAINTIHSTNVNPRTFWANRGFIITTVQNVVGFISLWKQRKKVCVAGTIQKLQSKIIALIFLRRIIYVNSFFKFVSVKHNGSLSSSLRWGYSFKFVKKSMYYLTSWNKITHQTLGFFEVASTSVWPCSVVTSCKIDLEKATRTTRHNVWRHSQRHGRVPRNLDLEFCTERAKTR